MANIATMQFASLPMDLPPVPVVAFRVLRASPGSSDGYLVPLPDVVPIRVTRYEGARPSTALLRYRIDEAATTIPTEFERLLAPGAGAGRPPDEDGKGGVPPSPYILPVDAEIAIAALSIDRQVRWLFDGFVQAPGLELDDQRQSVPIHAVGVEVRCWDTPLYRTAWRHARLYDDPEATVFVSGVPARFNPDGRPNGTGEGHDYRDTSGPVPLEYPVFIDHLTGYTEAELEDAAVRAWTLGGAARYVMGRGNAAQEWVELPPFATVDDELSAVEPATEGGRIDPAVPESFVREPIVVAESSASDTYWPDALADLIERHGFRFKFGIDDRNGLPRTGLVFYPTVAPLPRAERPLLLQRPGPLLDPGLSGLQRGQVQRDSSQVVQSWRVRMAPKRHEVALCLMPGFDIPDPEEARAEKEDYRATNATASGVNPRMFRSWVYSETGEGFLDESFTWRSGPEYAASLNGVLTAGRYAQKRRPGIEPLLSKGPDGEYRAKALFVLRGRPVEGAEPEPGEDVPREPYLGPLPGIYDGTGDISMQIKGGWTLDPERLGIIVTAEDPNAWDTNGNEGNDAAEGGVLRLIDRLCGKEGADPEPRRPLALVLVCVIEDDGAADAHAARTSAAPGRFVTERVVDARDRYRLDLIHRSSPYYVAAEEWVLDGEPQGVQIARDDARKAMAEARARRTATEVLPFAGEHHIPRLTNGYQVGARITGIRGRGLSYRTDAGQEGSPATYPRVVSVTWTFDPEQGTTLSLEDRRGVPDF